MKYISILSCILFTPIFSQIPSGDFETWNSFGSYMQPVGWVSTNEYSPGPFYAVTRDTSHFPSSIGSYSIRLENNLSYGFPAAGGAAKTGDTLFGNERFPISGHPTSLTGYYRFIPQNGDTMTIRLRLYQGSEVAQATLHTTVASPGWSSFNLPISAYASADSADLLLSAFYIDSNSVAPYPQGGSVLYVDNLNFDNLIAGINDISATGITIYPNPATNELFINAGDHSEYLQLEIMDQLGKIVMNSKIQNKQNIDISFLTAGIYQICIRNYNQVLAYQKLRVMN